ncbi:MAG: chemotaxis protein CheW [Candidatus Eisenbacteria bacterium]
MNSVLDTSAWCTFRLAGRLYGVPVEQVQEVLRPTLITRMPLASPAVRGLLHLRGAIVTVIDLALVLDLPAADDTPRPHIVVRDGDRAVSLLVDAIGDVQRHARGDIQPSPDTLPLALRALVIGAIPREHELLLVLHLEALMQRAFEPQGGPERREDARECA